jgi:hypothetical protein
VSKKRRRCQRTEDKNLNLLEAVQCFCVKIRDITNLGDRGGDTYLSQYIAQAKGLDEKRICFRFPVGAEMFLFATASKQAQGPIQILWVRGPLSLGIKLPAYDLHLVPKVMKAWSRTSTRKSKLTVTFRLKPLLNLSS